MLGVEQGDKEELPPCFPRITIHTGCHIRTLEKCVSVFDEHKVSFLILQQSAQFLRLSEMIWGEKKEKLKNKFFQTTENILKLKSFFVYFKFI